MASYSDAVILGSSHNLPCHANLIPHVGEVGCVMNSHGGGWGQDCETSLRASLLEARVNADASMGLGSQDPHLQWFHPNYV